MILAPVVRGHCHLTRALPTGLAMARRSYVENFRQRLLSYTGGSVDIETDDMSGIALVTLNNPDKKNALTGKMMLDFEKAVTVLENWEEGKTVILRGSGNTFCSGGDLKTVKNILNSEDGLKMSEIMHSVTERLLSLPMISVALVEGVALGGGAELTTSCDFRVMTQQARIGFVQVKMGVITGWGGGTRLVRLIGRRNALKLLSSGDVLDAWMASNLELVDAVIPDADDKLEWTKTWLSKYCSRDVSLVRSVKFMVDKADNKEAFASLGDERDRFSKLWGGELQKNALEQNLKH